MQQLPVERLFLIHQPISLVIDHIKANRIPHPEPHMSMNILQQRVDLHQSPGRPHHELLIIIVGICQLQIIRTDEQMIQLRKLSGNVSSLNRLLRILLQIDVIELQGAGAVEDFLLKGWVVSSIFTVPIRNTFSGMPRPP